MWPISLPFSFRNNSKMYGSPMLDAPLAAADICASSENLAETEAYAAILSELDSA